MFSHNSHIYACERDDVHECVPLEPVCLGAPFHIDHTFECPMYEAIEI